MSATPGTPNGDLPDAGHAAAETPAAEATPPVEPAGASAEVPPKAGTWLVQNQTARRIAISDGDGKERLLLAPLEERLVDSMELAQLKRDEWERANVIRCEEPLEKKKANWEEILKAISGLVAVWAFGGAILSGKPEMWTPLFSLYGRSVTPGVLYWSGIPTVAALVSFSWYALSGERKRTLKRTLAHLVGLFLIILIAVGLPFFGSYKLGGATELFASDSPLLQLGRWLQVIFITIASALPALLYYLFDRQQLATLKEKFWRDILRLDPYVRTLSEVKAKYGKQIDEVYGSDSATGAGRLLADTRLPIPVATLVITFGWFMAFLPARSAVELTQPSDLYKLLTPQSTAVAFGFLGAYLYGLNLVLRRYVLGDLRPKTYTNITVRILTIFVLAWLLSAVLPEHGFLHASVLAFSFIAGIVPETVLTYLQEKYQSVGIARGAPLKDLEPLTELEGIDLYDRARLMDEGVTNIENLAHHDIVDLMLQTRIPTQRIVDWVDQSILYLHLGGAERADACLKRLHGYGVRTATSLLKACEDEGHKRRLSALLQHLDCNGPGERSDGQAGDGAEEGRGEATGERAKATAPPDRLPIIITALEGAEWLEYIRYWRNYRLRDQRTVTDPLQIVKPEPEAIKHQVFQTHLKEKPERTPHVVGELN